MPKFWKTFIQIIIVIIILALGPILGALIGGNYATEVQLNGVRGYEATAQIGFICSITLLIVWGFYTYRKNK